MSQKAPHDRDSSLLALNQTEDDLLTRVHANVLACEGLNILNAVPEAARHAFYAAAFLPGSTQPVTVIFSAALACGNCTSVASSFLCSKLVVKGLRPASQNTRGGKNGCRVWPDICVPGLPHHGGSCPAGVGASSTADRNINVEMKQDGRWPGKQECNPSRYIPEVVRQADEGAAVKIELSDILRPLSHYPVATRLALSGTIVVARDIAHAKLKERIDNGHGWHQCVNDFPGYFADPAKTPQGFSGVTFAGRMDSYGDLAQANAAPG